MPCLLLLQGLPASGKSTWAKELLRREPGVWKRANRDDLRLSFDQVVFAPKNESFITKVEDFMIRQALQEGFNVVVDNTNLNPKVEKHLRDLAGPNVTVEVKFFDTPLEECIRRDALRENAVGEKVIRDMHQKYLQSGRPSNSPAIQKETEPAQLYSYDVTRDDIAIICDLDGTLAVLNGRNPYDASTCENDSLNVAPYMTLMAFKEVCPQLEIFLVSGREDKYRQPTEVWLRKYAIPYNVLYMRPTGDNRKDSIIKKEIFEAHLKDKNVAFVLDDRNQVVATWRALGLTVFQVADGNF